MYIAVFRYKTSAPNADLYKGYITVLDTTDGVVERVSVKSVIDGRLIVENYEVSDGELSLLDSSGYGYIPCSGSDMFLREESGKRSMGWLFRSLGILHAIYLNKEHGQINFVVDNITIPVRVSLHYNLSYMFRWRTYTVLRFYYSIVGITLSYNWFTICISDSGDIDYWSTDFRYVSNKALAMQIDTSLEV